MLTLTRLSHPGAPSVFVLNRYTLAVPDNHFVHGAQRMWEKQREEREGVIVASWSPGRHLRARCLFPNWPRWWSWRPVLKDEPGRGGRVDGSSPAATLRASLMFPAAQWPVASKGPTTFPGTVPVSRVGSLPTSFLAQKPSCRGGRGRLWDYKIFLRKHVFFCQAGNVR